MLHGNGSSLGGAPHDATRLGSDSGGDASDAQQTPRQPQQGLPAAALHPLTWQPPTAKSAQGLLEQSATDAVGGGRTVEVGASPASRSASGDTGSGGGVGGGSSAGCDSGGLQARASVSALLTNRSGATASADGDVALAERVSSGCSASTSSAGPGPGGLQFGLAPAAVRGSRAEGGGSEGGAPVALAPPSKAVRDAAHFQRRLTSEIMHLEELGPMRDLIGRYEGCLNAIHATALLTRLSQLATSGRLRPRDLRALSAVLALVLDVVRQQLPNFDGRCCYNSLVALAKLELSDRELTAQLLEVSEPLLATFSPQGLANATWALAKLGRPPPPRWTQLLFANSSHHMARLNPQELSNLGWGVAKLALRPPVGWLGEWQAAVEAAGPAMSPQGLANVAWAMAVLQPLAPGPMSDVASTDAWLLGLERCFSRQLHASCLQALSTLLAAFARLGYAPRPAFVSAALTRSAALLPSARPSEVVAMPVALAHMDHCPSTDWHAAHMTRAAELLPRMTVRQMVNLLWACARLRRHPGDAWLGRAQRRLAGNMAIANARDLANGLWAIARLGGDPGPEWMALYCARAVALAPEFKPQEVSNTVWALARLMPPRTPPPRALIAALCGVGGQRLSAFKPCELAALLWGLARLRVLPGRAWRDEALQATFHKAPSMGPQGLATLLWSAAELDLQPPPAWLYALASATRACLDDFSPLDLAQAAHGLQRFCTAGSQLPRLVSLLEDLRARLAAAGGAARAASDAAGAAGDAGPAASPRDPQRGASDASSHSGSSSGSSGCDGGSGAGNHGGGSPGGVLAPESGPSAAGSAGSVATACASGDGVAAPQLLLLDWAERAEPPTGSVDAACERLVGTAQG